MENATIVSWLKVGKRLTAELEQCEKSLFVTNSNPKIGTSPVKNAKSGLNSKVKDKDSDTTIFAQFNEDAKKEWAELLKQRDSSKQFTMKRIMGLKLLFDAVREKLGDIHLLNNAAQNNFQDMLETFENKLTTFKQAMKAEFDTMEETECALNNEMTKMKLNIDSWDNSTAGSSPPSGAITGSPSNDSNSEQLKKNFNRMQKEVNRKAIIGTLDRKIAIIGRYGGWDPRDHDSFLKYWNQIIGTSPDQFADQLEISENQMPQEESLELPLALKQTLKKKLISSVPGKAAADFEEHISWYLKYLFLTLLKKKVVSDWKRETEQARSKQSEDALNEEVVSRLPDRDSADSAEDGEQPATRSPEEERQAAKEKLARWKAEKQRQLESEKLEKLKLLEDERRRLEEEKKKRAQEKLQVEEWRRAEQLAAETAKIARQQTPEVPAAEPSESLAERQKKALESAKIKHAKVDSALQKKLERERKIKEAGAALKLANTKDIPRSISRMNQGTKASEASRLTPDALDEAASRRSTASAHSARVPMTGRDLKFAGRAIPTWCKNANL